MTTRTIPQSFPHVLESDGFTRTISRADLIRKLARAQNYLWANVRRTYANCAGEGNGYELAGIFQTQDADPDYEPTIPGGSYGGGLLACSFLVPPTWGASSRLKIQGRSVIFNSAGGGIGGGTVGKVVACVFSTDDVFLGTSAVSSTFNTAGAHSWSIELMVPKSTACQVRIYIAGTMTSGVVVWDTHRLEFVSARFQAGNAVEMAGETPPTDWKPLAHLPANYLPQSSAMMRALIRNTNAHWSLRAPEVCQSYLADPKCNTSTYTEVGRYVVFLGPKVTAINGYLHAYCTHGGAGNDIKVYVDGVLKQTTGSLSAGANDVVLTAANFTGLTANTEHTITIEARSTAAAADWGTCVWGVGFWEENVTLGLPGGTSVPSDYAPLDESALQADQYISDDLTGSTEAGFVRAGLLHLFKNDTWLARHRLRGLIGDWRRKVLKRAGPSVDPASDWTRVFKNVAFFPGTVEKSRNITILSYVPAGDGAIGIGVDPNNKDGIATWPDGLSMPPPLNGQSPVISDVYGEGYWRAGRRLARFYLSAPSGASVVGPVVGSQLRGYVRGNRAGPSVNTAIAPEEQFWTNTCRMEVWSGAHVTQAMIFPIFQADGADKRPHWYGPSTYSIASGGAQYFIVEGMMNYSYQSTDAFNKLRYEGNLYEVQNRGVLLMDSPLTQAVLDALT